MLSVIFQHKRAFHMCILWCSKRLCAEIKVKNVLMSHRSVPGTAAVNINSSDIASFVSFMQLVIVPDAEKEK